MDSSMTSLDCSAMSVTESVGMTLDNSAMMTVDSNSARTESVVDDQGAAGQVSSSAGVSSQSSPPDLSDNIGGAHNNVLITKNPIKFNLKSSNP